MEVQTAKARVKDFLRRKGAKGTGLAALRRIRLYLWRRPTWTLRHYFYRSFRTPKVPPFAFQGMSHGYLYSRMNFTWRNERTIEAPIVWDRIKDADPKKVLEVGNVLHNYYPIGHDVVDKYEKGKNVINEDALTFSPAGKKYDWIVSISTLEHAGWDWPEEKEPRKIPPIIENLKRHLAPGGRMIITMPLGYNPFLDSLIEAGDLGLEPYFLKRVSKHNEWKEASYEEVRGSRYDCPFPSANGIFVGMFRNGSQRDENRHRTL